MALRINQATAEADLRGSVAEGLSFVILPKTEHRSQVVRVCSILSKIEASLGLPADSIGLRLSVESAAGLSRVATLARGLGRVEGVGGGGGLDMAASLVIDLYCEEDQFSFARGEIEIEARRQGLEAHNPPFVGNTAGMLNPDLARRTARAAFRSGTRGDIAVHPAIVPIQLEGYLPSACDLGESRRALRRRRVGRVPNRRAESRLGISERAEIARARSLLDFYAAASDVDRERQARRLARPQATQCGAGP
jgi:citrate lyase subunit beta / citryl-CoA lyase